MCLQPKFTPIFPASIPLSCSHPLLPKSHIYFFFLFLLFFFLFSRHCIMSTGQVAHESVWRLMLDSLERALDITLYSLKQLMTPFKEDSDNFYGDVGHVKIAVRKDCSGIECERLRQLAQQVSKASGNGGICLLSMPLSLQYLLLVLYNVQV